MHKRGQNSKQGQEIKSLGSGKFRGVLGHGVKHHRHRGCRKTESVMVLRMAVTISYVILTSGVRGQSYSYLDVYYFPLTACPEVSFNEIK